MLFCNIMWRWPHSLGYANEVEYEWNPFTLFINRSVWNKIHGWIIAGDVNRVCDWIENDQLYILSYQLTRSFLIKQYLVTQHDGCQRR